MKEFYFHPLMHKNILFFLCKVECFGFTHLRYFLKTIYLTVYCGNILYSIMKNNLIWMNSSATAVYLHYAVEKRMSSEFFVVGR
jgi:hypothetical protein